MSWRDVLPIHPAAELFPRMSPDELKELGADIVKNEQRVPIAIIERSRPRPDGTFHVGDPPLQEVLDGISRLDAMEAAGIAVTGTDGQLHKQVLRTVVDTDEVDPVAYVISANIHRRHLTGEQKRDLIGKLLKADPSRSDRQIGEMVKAYHKTVGAVRAHREATGEISPVEKRVGADGKRRKQATKPAKVVAPPPQPLNEAPQAAAESPVRPVPPPSPPPPASRDDIGPDSANEAARLRVYVEKLEAKKRCLEMKVAGLESEIEELRGKLATGTGGDMSISEFSTAIKKWEDTVETQKNIIRDLQNENAKLRAGVAAPCADDGLGIPKFLDRSKQTGAAS